MTTPSLSSDWHVAGPTCLEIRMQRDGEVVYVEPAGELELATTGTLRDQVDALMTAKPRQVVIDLRRLTFIDCAGVRALLALDRVARRHGTQLSLIRGHNPACRIFALTATLDALAFTEAPRP